MNRLRKVLLLLTSAICAPGVAYANAGLPMLILVMPALALSLIPVVAIEAIYLQRKLGIPVRPAGMASLAGNVVSTFAGIPLTWLALVVLEIVTGGGEAYGLDSILGKVAAVTWQAPWLIPYEEGRGWMIPIAGTFLLIPFFFVSWWVEYRVCLKRIPDRPKNDVSRAVRNANLISYALLLLWPIAYYFRGP